MIQEVPRTQPSIVIGEEGIISEMTQNVQEPIPLPVAIPEDWSRIEIDENGEITRILNMTTVE
jgi:hypothetical protein